MNYEFQSVNNNDNNNSQMALQLCFWYMPVSVFFKMYYAFLLPSLRHVQN